MRLGFEGVRNDRTRRCTASSHPTSRTAPAHGRSAYASLGLTAVTRCHRSPTWTQSASSTACACGTCCLDLAGADQTSGATPALGQPSFDHAMGQQPALAGSPGITESSRRQRDAHSSTRCSRRSRTCTASTTPPRRRATASIRRRRLTIGSTRSVPIPNNPTCIWYNSDPGKIGLFDAFTGAAECTANPVVTLQPSAFAPRFVCATSGGIDRWVSLEARVV